MNETKTKALELAIQYFAAIPDRDLSANMSRAAEEQDADVQVVGRLLKTADRFLEYIINQTS